MSKGTGRMEQLEESLWSPMRQKSAQQTEGKSTPNSGKASNALQH